MSFSPLINNLIQALQCLPGVGPKSAQRMTFHLLGRKRDAGKHLAKILQQAMIDVGKCESCRTFCEFALCNLCKNTSRDQEQLCVVETPADIIAMETAGSYRGLYFVLMGHLSPIDGIGPEEIGVPKFIERLGQDIIKEVILATNPTVEGEATAYYLAEVCKGYKIITSRIAHGVPMGGELEHLDGNTLAKALASRAPIA